VSLSPVPSIPGEHPANPPFHIPVVTFMSPTLSPSRLSSAWPCSILSLFPFSRPRLEVLNASQNRIRHMAGLSLLPCLVVLNLGEWPCIHKSARRIRPIGDEISPTPTFPPRSTQSPLYGRPRCYSSLDNIIFSCFTWANPPPLLLIFGVVVPMQMTTPLMNSSLTAPCLDCAYCA
jgi:hypothetical protein